MSQLLSIWQWLFINLILANRNTLVRKSSLFSLSLKFHSYPLRNFYFYLITKNGLVSKQKKIEPWLSIFEQALLLDHFLKHQPNLVSQIRWSVNSHCTKLHLRPHPESNQSHYTDIIAKGQSVTVDFGLCPKHEIWDWHTKLLSVKQCSLMNPLT